MALYTIGDTHLCSSVPKPMDVFGGRWKDHMDKIRTRWSSLVTDSDTVVIPGDFSWALNLGEAAGDFRFISSLPGKKIISKGNHDYWWTTVSKLNRLLEKENISGISFLYNNAFMVDGITVCGSRGWFVEEKLQADIFEAEYEKIVMRECERLMRSISEGEKLKCGGDIESVVFLHFPPVFGDFICRPIIDVLRENGISRVYYGHIHGNYLVPSTFEYSGINFSLVSADYIDFTPLRVFV